jgi:hypothetical protein
MFFSASLFCPLFSDRPTTVTVPLLTNCEFQLPLYQTFHTQCLDFAVALFVRARVSILHASVVQNILHRLRCSLFYAIFNIWELRVTGARNWIMNVQRDNDNLGTTLTNQNHSQRTNLIWELFSTTQFRVICLALCHLKIEKLKYIKLTFYLMFCVGVELISRPRKRK